MAEGNRLTAAIRVDGVSHVYKPPRGRPVLALGPAAAFSVFVIVVVFAVVSGLSLLLTRLRAPTAGAAARSLLGG